MRAYNTISCTAPNPLYIIIMKFKQMQQRVIDFYIHYLGDMNTSASDIRWFTKDMRTAKKLPELVGAFEAVGFDTDDAYEFILNSIIDIADH